MQLRKDTVEAERPLNPGRFYETASSRRWWKGFHNEIISLLNKPQLVHRFTKKLLFFANRGPATSVSPRKPEPRIQRLKRTSRRQKQSANVRWKDLTSNVVYNKGFPEENQVEQKATAGDGTNKSRRKTPLRSIQPSTDADDTSGLTDDDQPLQECDVVLEQFPEDAQDDNERRAATDSTEQTSGQGNSEKKSHIFSSNENNEANDSGDRVTRPQKPTPGLKPDSNDQRRRNTDKMVDVSSDVSDDEAVGTFQEVFVTRRDCDILDSDTEDFWAARKKFWNEVDYQKEAKELLGLNTDFTSSVESTPLEAPVSSRRVERPLDAGKVSPQRYARRDSAAQLKKSPHVVSPNFKRIPKWQIAKQLSVKVSRSGRTIKPPVDDSFL